MVNGSNNSGTKDSVADYSHCNKWLLGWESLQKGEGKLKELT